MAVCYQPTLIQRRCPCRPSDDRYHLLKLCAAGLIRLCRDELRDRCYWGLRLEKKRGFTQTGGGGYARYGGWEWPSLPQPLTGAITVKPADPFTVAPVTLDARCGQCCLGNSPITPSCA